jgi:hypothetical protein
MHKASFVHAEQKYQVSEFYSEGIKVPISAWAQITHILLGILQHIQLNSSLVPKIVTSAFLPTSIPVLD